jgi:hypothetical protein
VSRIRTITVTLALVLIGLATTTALGALPASPAEHGRCFPQRIWNAEPSYRPCAQITRLYEDGSFKFRVLDADGTVRYSGGVGAADR